jgi:hypothetical protein
MLARPEYLSLNGLAFNPIVIELNHKSFILVQLQPKVIVRQVTEYFLYKDIESVRPYIPGKGLDHVQFFYNTEEWVVFPESEKTMYEVTHDSV